LRIQAETLRPPLGEAPLGALLEVLLGVLLVEVGVLELLETTDVDISVSSEIGGSDKERLYVLAIQWPYRLTNCKL
jgi:hypothetical protein